MEAISSKSEYRALAMGFFDGVHAGHAALLNCAKKRAAEIGGRASVLSFDVHPDNLVFHTEVKLIGDSRSRRELISRCFGINDVIFIHFDERTKNMPWQEFLHTVVNEMHASWLIVGHDFTFGAKGEGNVERLKSWCAEHNVGCDVIPAVTMDGQIVSSTQIRKLIENGEIEKANRYLGHPHCLSDTVHSGYHLGRRLDAPTINMYFPDGVIVPRYGVYATKVVLADGSEYKAVTNVGVRPTVSEENRVSVESHLLDFSGDLYNSPARVDFYSFIRPERKFESVEALGEQIRKDSDCVRAYAFSE